MSTPIVRILRMVERHGLRRVGVEVGGEGQLGVRVVQLVRG